LTLADAIGKDRPCVPNTLTTDPPASFVDVKRPLTTGSFQPADAFGNAPDNDRVTQESK
jgi:hypothetical protein